MTTAAVTEKQLQAQVLQLARLSGWRCYHTYDSRRSAPGFPDLVLVRPPRLIFVELKTTTGRLRPTQAEWLDDLAGCEDAPEVHIWRPSSWDEIETTLARKILALSPIDNTSRRGHATGSPGGRLDRRNQNGGKQA